MRLTLPPATGASDSPSVPDLKPTETVTYHKPMIQLPQTTILQLPPSLPKPRLISRLDARVGLKANAAQTESIEF
jgi:hypothetical protein